MRKQRPFRHQKIHFWPEFYSFSRGNFRLKVRVIHSNGEYASDVPVLMKALDDDERQITNLPRNVARTDDHGIASFIVPTKQRYSQIRIDLDVGVPPNTAGFTETMKAYSGPEFIALKKPLLTKKFQINDQLESQIYFHPKGVFAGAVVAVVSAGEQIEYCVEETSGS